MLYCNLGKHLDASQYVHNFACVWISAGIIYIIYEFFSVFFFFPPWIITYLPTCPGMKLNLGGPKELYSFPVKTVLMQSSFLISFLWETIYWKELIVVNVYLLQVCTCIFLASWLRNRKRWWIKVWQGQMRTRSIHICRLEMNFCEHSAFWETLDGYICMPLHQKGKYATW